VALARSGQPVWPRAVRVIMRMICPPAAISNGRPMEK
jgi:hypothetical protein